MSQGRYRTEELLSQQIKEGRVLSSKNESDLRDAVDAHNEGNRLINGVLSQVVGPNAGDNPNPSPSSGDQNVGETNAFGRDSDIITVDSKDLAAAMRPRTVSDDTVVTVDSEDLAEVMHTQRTGVRDTKEEKDARSRRI
jgi:hypothetical protein